MPAPQTLAISSHLLQVLLPASKLLAPTDGRRWGPLPACACLSLRPRAHAAGLVLAAELKRAVVLPDWLLNGMQPDGKDQVTAANTSTVPFRWAGERASSPELLEPAWHGAFCSLLPGRSASAGKRSEKRSMRCLHMHLCVCVCVQGLV